MLRRWHLLTTALAVAAACLPIAGCRAPRTPAPPRPVAVVPVTVPLDAGPRELGPYLEQYPLGSLGRRKDMLAATATRSMHLVQLSLPLPSHRHPTRKETTYVLDGRGSVRIGDRTYPAAPGAAFRIDPGVAHAVLPDEGETLVAIVYYEPPLLHGDDSVPAH